MDNKLTDLTHEELELTMETGFRVKCKTKKKRMKESKKLVRALLIWTLVMQTYVMLMIGWLRDTQSLAIITGVVFLQATAAYLGYLRYNYGINLKAMEEHFDPNYDENKGVY